MFQVGDLVRSLVDAQGMSKGSMYRVLRRADRRTFAGTFTTYDVAPFDGGASFRVGNGHLVLKLVGGDS